MKFGKIKNKKDITFYFPFNQLLYIVKKILNAMILLQNEKGIFL